MPVTITDFARAARQRATPAQAGRLAAFAGLTLGTGAVCAMLALYLTFAPSVPRFAGFDDFQPKLGARIYSADNQLIGEFAQERRIMVPAEDLPPLLFDAFMAAEDKRFRRHSGVDVLGIAQALGGKLLRPKEKLRGASTITQQVAKSLLASHQSYERATERSLGRKVREAILARHLEHTLSKDQILFMYLTQTFLGHKAYGVGAAAEHYFRKHVSELTIGEMATLAGLPQRPSDYSPVGRPEAARRRRAYVLRRMAEDGYITQAQRQAGAVEPLVAYGREEVFLQMAPHYTEQVRRQLIDRYGERAVLEDGLQVYTALNLQRQFTAQAAVARGLRALDRRQGFRGPIASLGVEKRAAFVASYRQSLKIDGAAQPTLLARERYLAFVTGIGSGGNSVQVDVAGLTGIIPLAAMRWARKPNPFERLDRHLLRDVRDAVMAGDIVWVSPTSRAALLEDPLAADDAQALSEAQPLFALEQDPISEAALVSIDASSAYVEVMIGGANFDESSYNRATQACREPGSAFKPVVYSAAIDKYDYSPSTQVDDKPIIFDDPNNQTRWKPNNAGEQFRGRLPMRTCFKDSINTPAVRVADAVGLDDILKNARRLGITTQLKRELGTALGSSCTTLMEMMNVYVTLNRMGERHEPVLIRRVVDRFGNVLDDHSAPQDPTLDWASRLERGWRKVVAPPQQVLDPASTFITVSLMRDAVNYGTGIGASRIGQQVAGKTGTTNDSFDAWFMGFTPNIVTGVWVGFDRNERPLGVGEGGGKTALPIWVDSMDNNLVDHSVSPARRLVDGTFAPPPGVVEVRIDPETAMLARPGEGRSVMEWYRAGTEPTEMAPDKAILNPVDIDMFKADAPF